MRTRAGSRQRFRTKIIHAILLLIFNLGYSNNQSDIEFLDPCRSKVDLCFGIARCDIDILYWMTSYAANALTGSESTGS